MTSRITPKEWETLSAYLDGQISVSDRIRLERLLTERPEMRVALTDLRRTRDFLRSQPSLRAPRNFTLSPQLAGIRIKERRSSFAFPVLSAVSALASILFLLVFVGDMLITGAGPSQDFVAQAPIEDYPAVEETVPESFSPAPIEDYPAVEETVPESFTPVPIEDYPAVEEIVPESFTPAPIEDYPAVEETVPEPFSPAEGELQEIHPTEITLQEVQVPSVAAESEVLESMVEEEVKAVSKVIEPVDESRDGDVIQTPILAPVSPDFEAVPGGKADQEPGLYDEGTGRLEPSVDQDIPSTARLIEKLPFLMQQSTMRIFEVVLIMIAFGAGLAALYIRQIGKK